LFGVHPFRPGLFFLDYAYVLSDFTSSETKDSAADNFLVVTYIFLSVISSSCARSWSSADFLSSIFSAERSASERFLFHTGGSTQLS